MKTKVLTVLAILIVSFNAIAWDNGTCTIEIRNLSETATLNFWVWWVDHDCKDWPYPFQIIGGELKLQEKHSSEYAYSPGRYIIQWQGAGECCGKNSQEFYINHGAVKVVVGISEIADSYMFLEIYGI